MSKTNAVEIRIQEVSPVSSFGVAAAGATGSAGATTVAVAAGASVVTTVVVCSVGVGVDAASSAHAAEPPKSALDKPSAKSIFFICIPQPKIL